MLGWRLNPETHGTNAVTTLGRVVGVLVLVAGFAVGLQLALVAWYDGRMMPGVVAAGRNVGDQTILQARQSLQQAATAYRLKLTIGGHQFSPAPAELGVSFDIEGTLQMAYAAGRNDFWHLASAQPVPMAFTVDQKKLSGFVANVATEVGVPATDAGIKLAGAQATTVADKPGQTVDKGGLVSLIEQNLEQPGTDAAINLSTKPVQADIRQADLSPAVAATNNLTALSIALHYDGKTYQPSPADIASWLVYEKHQQDGKAVLTVVVDSSRVKDYVQNIANDINQAPVNKKVTVTAGVSKTTQEGKTGLTVQQDDLVAAITGALNSQQSLSYDIKTSVLPFLTVTTQAAGPTSLDLGGYVEVNLTTQHLWVWQDHQVIYESPVTSGATGAGLGTVTGMFAIYYKTTNTHLDGHPYGYNYDVPVQYWMPFYLGYGLHDASWRTTFGGPDYYYGGSHGCINLPLATAAFIYNWSVVGTPVWVHN